MCERKRRLASQNDKYVVLGFYAYQKFHEMSYVGRKAKTFDEFAKSRLYTSFTRFGRYLLNLHAIQPKEFIIFLIKAGVKIDDWEKPSVYETYIRELNKKETPEVAVERAFLLMQQWANEEGEVWTDFFRKISPIRATIWLQSGRISPWVLFLSESGPEMLMNRLSDEQRSLVYSIIEPEFWNAKFKVKSKEADFIRDELLAAGI